MTTYRWTTLADAYDANAARHEARALWHEAEGHPAEWAAGSRRKAQKWRNRAAAFRDLLDPNFEHLGPTGALLAGKVRDVSKAIARSLNDSLYGGSP